MSTYMAKPEAVERKWYILDAAGKPLGRTAAQAAVLLRASINPPLPLMSIAETTLSLLTLRRQF